MLRRKQLTRSTPHHYLPPSTIPPLVFPGTPAMYSDCELPLNSTDSENITLSMEPHFTSHPDAYPEAQLDAAVLSVWNLGSESTEFIPGPCGQTSRNHYASPADWKQHKSRIIRLYQIEHKKLKDVKAIMENNHHFFATERMYKARFKEWDIYKNIRAKVVLDTVRRPATLQERSQEGHTRYSYNTSSDPETGSHSTAVTIPAHLSRINRYIKRNPARLGKLATQDRDRALSLFSAQRPETHEASTDQHVRHEASIDMPSPPWRSLPQVLQSDPREILKLLQNLFSWNNSSAYPVITSLDSTVRNLQPSGQLPGADYWHPDGMPSSREDRHMLKFVLRFRLAHVFTDEGYQHKGSSILQECWDNLSNALQPAGSSSFPAIKTFTYGLLSALEIMASFKSPGLSFQLFDHIAIKYAGQHPLIADVAIQLSNLEGRSLFETLDQARPMIWSGLSCNPILNSTALQIYMETVDIVIQSASITEACNGLQTLAGQALTCLELLSPDLIVWVEVRNALAT